MLKRKIIRKNVVVTFFFWSTSFFCFCCSLSLLWWKIVCLLFLQKIKWKKGITSYVLYRNFSNYLFSSVFPAELKKTDITPVYKKKKKKKYLKENYRPVSILPSISKFFERCMHNQVNWCFMCPLSKVQCGFQKVFIAQHCLLVLLEKCCKVLDESGFSGIVMINLSNAFDSTGHQLLIAKLHELVFSTQSLESVNSCLSGKKQRVHMNPTFSEWYDVTCCVP